MNNPPSTPLFRHFPRNLGGISEDVNRKRVLRLQDKMFCAPGRKTCSPVHWMGFLSVFCNFRRFFVIQFTLYCLCIYVEVKNYEAHGDSMRQFAMYQVNK